MFKQRDSQKERERESKRRKKLNLQIEKDRVINGKRENNKEIFIMYINKKKIFSFSLFVHLLFLQDGVMVIHKQKFKKKKKN